MIVIFRDTEADTAFGNVSRHDRVWRVLIRHLSFLIWEEIIVISPVFSKPSLFL